MFPSIKSKTVGLKRYMRNAVTDTGLFGVALAVYNRECEVLFEGDKISIFGKLVYDVKNDQFSFDSPYGVFQGAKENL